MNAELMLIHEIEEFGSTPIIEHLCDEVSDINEVIRVPYPFDPERSYATTFLTRAIGCRNIEAIDVLLRKGADPNLVSKELYYTKTPPLYNLSIFTGETTQDAIDDIRITKLLLDHGADPNVVIPGKNQTILSYAEDCMSGDFDPSGDYDYRYSRVFFELLEGYANNKTIDIDMYDLLSVFKDE